MTFTKVWKTQIVKPAGKASIWSPKEKMKPDKPDKDKCCEEAREYYISQRVAHPGLRVVDAFPLSPVTTKEEWWASNKRWAENCDEFIKEIRKWQSPLEYHLMSTDAYDFAQQTLKMYDECMGK
jgi:hypothetical protein